MCLNPNQNLSHNIKSTFLVYAEIRRERQLSMVHALNGAGEIMSKPLTISEAIQRYYSSDTKIDR